MKSFRIVRFIAVAALLAFSYGCLGNRAITVQDSPDAGGLYPNIFQRHK